MRTIAAHQVNLVHLLDLHEGERVSLTRIDVAAVQWSLPGGRRCRRPAEPEQGRRFFGHAVRWLRFVDMLEEPEGTPHSHAGEVAAFTAWMRKERGWSEDTVHGCCGTVDCFFDWLDEWGIALASVEIVDIDRAVARWHARDLSRVTIHDYVQRLRTFFRFAEHQGWCAAGLSDGIKPSRFHAGETVPKGLARDEVLRLLATTDSNQPVDVRDRALLMVLIAYGLRSGEVAGLRSDDLDWEEEMLRVRCPKPGRTHHYPLSRGVGQAILRYISDVRPPRPDRVLFLSVKAPIRRSVDAPHCTIERETAHRTGTRRVLYRWHPWSGRLVRVRDVVEKAGIARARCALDGAAPGLWQEVPLWMFDRVACAGMRVEERAMVDLSTLSALASLVSDALGKSVSSRAGWVSDDQDRGETHARSTRGASQARERIGATRSVRPGGEQQSGGHAGVARASGPHTPEGDRTDGPADAGARARAPRSGSGRS